MIINRSGTGTQHDKTIQQSIIGNFSRLDSTVSGEKVTTSQQPDDDMQGRGARVFFI